MLKQVQHDGGVIEGVIYIDGHPELVSGSIAGKYEVCEKRLRYSVLIHNPNANNPLPHGILGAIDEYWVEEHSGIHKVESR